LPDGETEASISGSPTMFTNYSVEYTVGGCTSALESIDIDVNDTPTITVSDVAICEGVSATLTTTVSGAGGIYAWSPDGEVTA